MTWGEWLFAGGSGPKAGAQGSLAEVEGSAIGVDIAQADKEVGVGGVAGDPKAGADTACDFDGLAERFG